MMNRYKQLLTYIKTAVTRNYSEKSINSILDYISTSKQVTFFTNYTKTIKTILMLIRLFIHRLVIMHFSCTFLSVNIIKQLEFHHQMELLQNFYETTLEALREAKNDRLWFKTNTKLGKLYFDREEFTKLQRILKQLHQSCQVGPITKKVRCQKDEATFPSVQAFGEIWFANQLFYYGRFVNLIFLI